MTAPRRPIEAGEPHAALAAAGDGKTRTVTTCSSRRSGRDAWFAAAPRPLRVQWLLARPSGGATGADLFSRIIRRRSTRSRRSVLWVWLSSVAYAKTHVYDSGGRAADGWHRVLRAADRTGAKPIRPPELQSEWAVEDHRRSLRGRLLRLPSESPARRRPRR